MSKKLITTMVLAFTFAVVAAVPAAATPSTSSPGACNMLHVSGTGMDGMFKASEQGLSNMITLILASEASGCRL